MGFYIKNGIDEDASWTTVIAISKDNVHWTTIQKKDLSVKPSFISNPNTNIHYSFDTLTKIRLEYPNGKVAADFELQDVLNQAAWILGTEAALQVAVDDITSWL